jgi:predicted SAM-dependent methyltransferase
MPNRTLDIGCGWRKQPGSIGMDRIALPTVDVLHDFDDIPFPFEDDAFNEIHLVHVVEHAEDVIELMEEVHRIARSGARVRVVTPHYTDSMSWQDPTHRWHLNSYSFRYFEPRYQSNYYTKARFKVVSRHVSMARLWRTLGLEWLINLDERYRSMRVVRKFWEQYLCFIFRAKHLTFWFEVLES